jgi:predicted nucleotidyltransferase
MKMDIERVSGAVRQIALKLHKKGILAVSLFGSLARGDLEERSDIDIFVITEEELSLGEQDELYYAFSELIPVFRRDVTVLVYDLDSLKSIPTWQTLNLVKDAHFACDRAGIEKIFKVILQQAEEHGIVYDEAERVFKLKRVGRLAFSLRE